MRNYIMALVAFLVIVTFVNWKAQAEEKKEELACASNKDIEKIMNDKGYALLLNMTRKIDDKEAIETIWIGGQNIVITATVPKGETSCLMANMNNVIVNPETVEAIWENYKKQTKQKDI